MWASADVCGLLAVNLGSLANNLGPAPRILSINLGQKLRCLRVRPRMFAGRYKYLPNLRAWEPGQRSAGIGFLARLVSGGLQVRLCMHDVGFEPGDFAAGSFRLAPDFM